MSTDFLVGGTASADSYYSDKVAANACDDNESTYWYALTNTPHWWKYDLGITTRKVIKLLRIKPGDVSGGYSGLHNFVLKGSNDGVNWNTLLTAYHGNNTNWEDFAVPNTYAYQYYMLDGLNGYYNFDGHYYYVLLLEIEMLEGITSHSKIRCIA